MKEIVLNNVIELREENELELADYALVHLAKDACKRSYSPYSNFAVGAAVKLEDGTFVQGCNQENAAYGNCLCAERNAIATAKFMHPDKKIVALAVAAYTTESFTESPITPCGTCRQTLVEIETKQKSPIRIVLYGEKGSYIIKQGVSALMPLSFDTDALANI